MPVFQLILTSDTINQGRIKINNAFSATTGLWSGSTGFQSLIHNNGAGNLALGDYAVATGIQTVASGSGSTASGSGSTASGDFSFAGGSDCAAFGDYSFSVGFQNIASGSSSHAEGSQTIAIGNSSQTSGLGTIAPSDNQFVIGKWNDSGNTTDGAFIIGNGTNNLNRRNVLEVLSGGNNAVKIIGINNQNASNAFEVVNSDNDSVFKVTGARVGVNLTSPPLDNLHVNGTIRHVDMHEIDSSTTIQTTGNTPQLITVAVPTQGVSRLWLIKATILAYRTLVSPVQYFSKVFYFTAEDRSSTPLPIGAVLIGPINTIHEEATGTGLSLNVDVVQIPFLPSPQVGEGSLQIRVIGNASETWVWRCDIERRRMSVTI